MNIWRSSSSESRKASGHLVLRNRMLNLCWSRCSCIYAQGLNSCTRVILGRVTCGGGLLLKQAGTIDDSVIDYSLHVNGSCTMSDSRGATAYVNKLCGRKPRRRFTAIGSRRYNEVCHPVSARSFYVALSAALKRGTSVRTFMCRGEHRRTHRRNSCSRFSSQHAPVFHDGRQRHIHR